MGGSDPHIKRGKPAPDIYLRTAELFPDHPKPEKCLVFEDAPMGVSAAIAAGMQVVAVPDPSTEAELFRHATLILPRMDCIKFEMFGLPPLK